MGDVQSTLETQYEQIKNAGSSKKVLATRSCLPQVDPFVAERKEEVKRVNRQYEIDNYKGDTLRSGLPAGVCSVPPFEKRKGPGIDQKVTECIKIYLGKVGEEIMSKKNDRWESFEEIKTCVFTPKKGSSRGFPRVTVMERWLEDVEFGRQRITGAHVTVLTGVQKCELLPKKLLVTDEQVVGLIDEDSVEEAVAAKKLFIVDYHKLLDDIPTRKDAHLCSPIGLFYCSEEGVLLPIAIQLYGGPTAQDLNPVYTPNDNIWAWRMAKMFFNSADFHYHLIASFVCRCLLAVSLASVITCRCLSAHHPLRQLVEPFFKGCLGDADVALKTLLGKNCPAPMILSCGYDGWFKIASKSWAKFNFSNASFKHDYTERTDPDSPLRGYYYRSDGMLLWRGLDTYVSETARKYYQKPDDIDEDGELKKWTREMVNHFNRFMELQTCRKEQPIVFDVTSLLYMATGLKDGLLHNMYQQYAWVPNAPGLIVRGPIIEKAKDQITESDLLSLLPDKRTTVLQIATAYVLSGLFDDKAAPHVNMFAFPNNLPLYADNLGTGFSLTEPDLPDPNGPKGPNGEEWNASGKQDIDENKPVDVFSDTVVVDVYGIAGDHRHYTIIRGSDMPLSDAGDEVLETFTVSKTPKDGLVEWEIRKAEGKIGNWVAPKGEAPISGPGAENKTTVQAVFYAVLLDPSSLSFPPRTIFVRLKSGSTLLPAATSVGSSSYQDGYWDVIHAFCYPPPAEGCLVAAPQWEEVDEDDDADETPSALREPFADMRKRITARNDELEIPYAALRPWELFEKTAREGFLY